MASVSLAKHLVLKIRFHLGGSVGKAVALRRKPVNTAICKSRPDTRSHWIWKTWKGKIVVAPAAGSAVHSL